MEPIDTPESKSSATEPKLCWYQYRLRTLLIVTFLFAVACSWFVVMKQEAEKQRIIRQAVEKEGGYSMYDFQVQAQEKLSREKFDLHAISLIHTAGNDFFDDISKVSLSYSLTLTDSDLAQLAELKHLSQLELNDTRITDAGLQYLMGLKELEFLDLRETKVTDAGVAKLRKALPKCRIER